MYISTFTFIWSKHDLCARRGYATPKGVFVPSVPVSIVNVVYMLRWMAKYKIWMQKSMLRMFVVRKPVLMALTPKPMLKQKGKTATGEMWEMATATTLEHK